MSDNKDFFPFHLKSEMKDAFWRVFSKNIAKSINKAIISYLQKRKTSNETITLTKEFLESSFGEAVVIGLLGSVIPYIPNFPQDEKLQKLLSEFRVYSLTLLGDKLSEIVSTNFLPIIENLFLPKEEP